MKLVNVQEMKQLDKLALALPVGCKITVRECAFLLWARRLML